MTPDNRGLSAEDVLERRRRDGMNVLPRPGRRSPLRQLVGQWTHFFAVLLWVAAALAAVAGMAQLAVAIAVVVVINGLFAFAQEHRAERAADRLRDLLPQRVTVRRDGVIGVVAAEDLVVDDVVLLAAGDRVSADLIVLDANALSVDTSTMTGESVPEHPSVGDAVYAGTFVVEGEAETRVTAIGGSTELATIAALTTRDDHRATPLALELTRLVRVVAAIAVGVGIGFFAVSQLVGMAAGDGFLFGVGVTVALVPEGLLPTVTLSLAMGAQRMAASHALVRRLEAVQTLGSTTFICTDKTGTLTCNEMSIVAAWTPSGQFTVDDVAGYDPTTALHVDDPWAPQLAAHALTCSDGLVACDDSGRWHAVGDPMEAAIDVLARRLGVTRMAPILRRYPFDPRRRRMSVVTGETVVVKGAPDSVMPRCVDVGDAPAVVERFAERGWRTLAVARRRAPEVLPDQPDDIERDLELLGVLAFEDPPRGHAAASIEACRRAGMKVAMITGDHPATAKAIADEIGLRTPAAPVVVGADLPIDDAELGELIDHDGIVLARVSPTDKLRIAAALRHRGHVVAMTGDGVNDGPALHEADIGIAMGRSGTDVAREAADLVLLDDDFGTIVRAVAQGRATFRNIRRFLTYHLTDNVAELTPFVVWALSGGSFPLAIGVLQVLALDIGTDMLPALALGAEPARRDLLDGPPVRGHLVDRTVVRRAFGRLGPTEAVVSMTAFSVVLAAGGWRLGDPAPGDTLLFSASGAAFTAIVLGQMATALACRSTTQWVGRTGIRGNRLLLGAIVAELALLAAFLYVPPIADALEQQPPSILGLVVAACSIPAVILVDLVDKLRHRDAHGH